MSRPYPCIYCTEDGHCKEFSDKEVTAWCVLGPCQYAKPSNADRIRSMTDEELAEFISGKARTFGEEYEGYMSALDWLKEEVDDAAND